MASLSKVIPEFKVTCLECSGDIQVYKIEHWRNSSNQVQTPYMNTNPDSVFFSRVDIRFSFLSLQHGWNFTRYFRLIHVFTNCLYDFESSYTVTLSRKLTWFILVIYIKYIKSKVSCLVIPCDQIRASRLISKLLSGYLVDAPWHRGLSPKPL